MGESRFEISLTIYRKEKRWNVFLDTIAFHLQEDNRFIGKTSMKRHRVKRRRQCAACSLMMTTAYCLASLSNVKQFLITREILSPFAFV